MYPRTHKHTNIHRQSKARQGVLALSLTHTLTLSHSRPALCNAPAHVYNSNAVRAGVGENFPLQEDREGLHATPGRVRMSQVIISSEGNLLMRNFPSPTVATPQLRSDWSFRFPGNHFRPRAQPATRKGETAAAAAAFFAVAGRQSQSRRRSRSRHLVIGIGPCHRSRIVVVIVVVFFM